MLETAHVLAQRRGANKIGALLRGEITGEEDASDEEAQLRSIAGGRSIIEAVGDLKAMEAIIKLGGDVNEISDIYGYGEGTALAKACFNCDSDSAELLCSLGANPNLKNGSGVSPIAWFFAGRKNMFEVGDIFNNNKVVKLIKCMIDAGFDINDSVDDKSNTALTFACLSPNGEDFMEKDTLKYIFIKELIKQGADVNKSNMYGQTPLMLACIGGRTFSQATEVQLLLLEEGAASCKMMFMQM